ncbi:MAG: hypothetical protein JWR43_2858 [Phenylobacterium sp.]|nr:hypothetical protein [Phenylobacterium sp.]
MINRSFCGIRINISQVFRVPQSIYAKDAQLFKPRIIRVGPYHRDEIDRNSYINNIRPHRYTIEFDEESVSGFYDVKLDVTSKQLLMGDAIHVAMFIDWYVNIHGIHGRYYINNFIVKIERRAMLEDIMMIENQIPLRLITRALDELNGYRVEAIDKIINVIHLAYPFKELSSAFKDYGQIQ